MKIELMAPFLAKMAQHIICTPGGGKNAQVNLQQTN